MENTFLQLIKSLKNQERPQYDLMSKEELISYIEKNLDEFYNSEKLLKIFKKAGFSASQISFQESHRENKPFSFRILEGTLDYHPKSNTFTFRPDPEFNKLIGSPFQDTILKNKLGNRFYKFLEFSFRVETDTLTTKNIGLNHKLTLREENKNLKGE